MNKYVTAFSAVVATALAAAAPEPVAVWNGDFSQVVEGYALDLNGNKLSADNTTITITNEYAGVDIDFTTPMTSGLTVLFKYADFGKGNRAKMIFTTCVDSGYSNDRTGVNLQSNDALWGAWYNGSKWGDYGDNSGSIESSGCLAFTYKHKEGTFLYYGATTNAIDSTAIWGNSGLMSSSDTSIYGCTIGGMRVVNTNWCAAADMTVTGIAVFDGVLSVEEMNGYVWPTTNDYTVTIQGDYSGTVFDGGNTTGMRTLVVEGDATVLGVTNFDQIVIAEGATLTRFDTCSRQVMWRNTDSTADIGAGSGESDITLCLPAREGISAGTTVYVTRIDIGMYDTAFDEYYDPSVLSFTVDGTTYASDLVSTSRLETTTMSTAISNGIPRLSFLFPDGVPVQVGTNYTGILAYTNARQLYFSARGGETGRARLVKAAGGALALNDYASNYSMVYEITAELENSSEAEFVREWLEKGFASDSAVVSNITTIAALVEFNAFLAECGFSDYSELTSTQKEMAYCAFQFRNLMSEAHIPEVVPEIAFDAIEQVSNDVWRVTLSCWEGETAVAMAEDYLAGMLRVGASVDDINLAPFIVTEPSADGETLSFTIDAPSEAAGFVQARDDESSNSVASYEDVRLWSSVSGDYYRIPAICTAPDGTLIAVCDSRNSSNSDMNANMYINTALRRSTDGGATWSEAVEPAEGHWNDTDGYITRSDPSLVVDYEAGKVFLFFNVFKGATTSEWSEQVFHFHVMESSDNGLTWSEEREILTPSDVAEDVAAGNTTNNWGWGLSASDSNWSANNSYFFISSGSGIQLSDGRLLHTLANRNSNAGVQLFGSSDHGETWHLYGNLPPYGNECKVVELPDGFWMINSRYASGYRYVYTSSDEGNTWSGYKDYDLVDPGCNAQLMRYGRALVFSNCKSTSRKNLYLRVSADSGATWGDGVCVDSASAAYSDVTILPNGRIGVLYEGSAKSGTGYDIVFKAIPFRDMAKSLSSKE